MKKVELNGSQREWLVAKKSYASFGIDMQFPNGDRRLAGLTLLLRCNT
jgi:hypothetical protein